MACAQEGEEGFHFECVITGDMRKRSEAIGATEHVDRFELLHRACGACGEASKASSWTKRASGESECPECGAPEIASIVGVTARTEAKQFDNDEDKPRAYCNQCGTEWGRVNGKPFPNCGHTDGFVDDPRKAKEIKPPAGHPISPLRESKIGAPSVKTYTEQAKELPEALRQKKTTLHVAWGKSMFRVADYSTFTVEPIDLYLEIEKPEDALEVGRALIPELRKMADELFESTAEWYAEKNGIVYERIAKKR